MHAPKQPDVIVVGAGPAGSAASILLARANVAVTVCERAIFPRHKVCGGCLSGDAVELLGELLGEDVAELGTNVTRITFEIGRHSFMTSGGGHCRIIPRDVLDTKLADAAVVAGANLRFGIRAELVQESVGRFGIRAGGQSLRPRWIFWAAGLHSLLKQDLLGPKTCNRALIGQAWSVVPGEVCPPIGGIAMHWLHGGYVGFATASAEQCLVALAIETRMPGRHGRLDWSNGGRPWDAFCAANPDARILRRINPPSSPQMLGTAGFPHRPRRVGCGNLLVVGDAAGFEEPFSGEGIGQALRSGMVAARTVLAGGSDDAAVLNYFEQLRHHRRIRRRTRWLSGLLRSRAAFALANSSIPVPGALVERVLKGVHVKPLAEGA
jgi:flavin-dependent dehydrogenase